MHVFLDKLMKQLVSKIYSHIEEVPESYRIIENEEVAKSDSRPDRSREQFPMTLLNEDLTQTEQDGMLFSNTRLLQ